MPTKIWYILVLLLLFFAIKSFISNLSRTGNYFYLSQIPIKEFQLQISVSKTPYILKLYYTKRLSLWPRGVHYIPARFALNIRSTNKRFITFSELEQSNEDHFIGIPPRREVFQLFPLDADLPKIVMKITQGNSIPYEPVNYSSMRYLKIPSRVCAAEGTNESDRFSIVVVVKTAVYNFERRRVHRETHAHVKDNQLNGLRIGIVYSVGIPRKIRSNKFNFSSGLTLELYGQNGRVLKEIPPNETRARLEKEMKEYDDLIVGDYEDTYYNLTLKMMHSYYWFAYFCHPNKPMLIYLDDDFTFNATYLRDYISNLSPNQRENLVAGYPKWHGPVVRVENANFGWKWGQLIAEEPWSYHAPHLLGPVAIVGYSAARAMAITMSFTRFGRIDDAWLGLVLAKLQLKITPFKNIYVFSIPNGTKLVAFSHIDALNKFIAQYKL